VLGTLGVLIAVAAFYARTVANIAHAKRAGKRVKFPTNAARRAPHTRVELSWWVAVSVSAGVCEEFIFRGYLIWLLQPVLGEWGAAAASVIVFAAAHAYQGAKGALAVGLVGSFFTLMVLVSGSLVPAIAVHALIDAAEGFVAWLALRDATAPGGRASVLGGSHSRGSRGPCRLAHPNRSESLHQS
jgi:membrane protease YdiL (CAAX protease family)